MIFAGTPEFGDEAIYFILAIWVAILMAVFVATVVISYFILRQRVVGNGVVMKSLKSAGLITFLTFVLLFLFVSIV